MYNEHTPRRTRSSLAGTPGQISGYSGGSPYVDGGMPGGGMVPHQTSNPYEFVPVPPGPLPVPVMTPTVNPPMFPVKKPTPASIAKANAFGVGHFGIDFLTRITFSLRSGIDSEVDWALTALVQATFNAPDQFKFRLNEPLIADLLERVLKARFLTHKESADSEHVGDTDADDRVHQSVLDIMLILRNAALDPENAQFLATSDKGLEVVLKCLQVSQSSLTSEVLSYAVDIIESISFYVSPTSYDDPMLQAVAHLLETSSDRAIIISTTRALTRMLVHEYHAHPEAETEPKEDTFPILTLLSRRWHQIVDKTVQMLLVEADEDLIIAALDFLYQITRRGAFVTRLLENNSNAEILSTHLARLLRFEFPNEKFIDYIRLPVRVTPGPSKKNVATVDSPAPNLPEDVLQQLLTLPEPVRATAWMRACYEETGRGEVTQISLWKSYESQFEPYCKEGSAPGVHRLLPAVEFIKNVNLAFTRSAAMVVNLSDGTKKFIIKGIQPRKEAIDPASIEAQKRAEFEHRRKMEAKFAEYDAARRYRLDNKSGVSPAAILVMTNIAKNDLGKVALAHVVDKVVYAGTVNPHIALYMFPLLGELESVKTEA
ncbi:Chromatin structure-remodeling complex subunit RSC9 [Yarrowia sp. B02]|nr:Chromatin structure-remodeling complex subunit RSC9 [Yarrowia sp. B02]